LNINTPTRIPFDKNQQETSPDVTIVPKDLSQKCEWKTKHALSSDHLPIITTINTNINFKQKQNLNCYSSYHKADWENFTKEIEEEIEKLNPPNNIHAANKAFTDIILKSDKHNIPKGKFKSKQQVLPREIRDLIEERNTLRKTDRKNSHIKTLNDDINKQISDHKSQIWKNKIEQNWDHKKILMFFGIH